MEKKKIQKFTDLLAWQEAHKLVLLVYRLTNRFPKTEAFGLASQMQRAAVSVSSNIAEGFGRQTYKERTRFFYLSQGSLTELKNQLIIARDVGYVSLEEFSETEVQADITHRVLQGLLTRTKQLSSSFS